MQGVGKLVAGDLLLGRYRLEIPLGRGGAATVWRARDTRLGRHVAIKALPKKSRTAAAAVAEARTVAGLSNPHITAMYELAEDDTTHRFRGDVALVNNRITVVLRKHGTGAEVYARDARGWRRRVSVSPVPPGGSSVEAFSAARIVENTPSGVRLDCRYRTAAQPCCRRTCRCSP